MSIGSILVGIALTLIVAAYVARPFRSARAVTDWDRTIEGWVAQARTTSQGKEAKEPKDRKVEEPVNFCAKCGRRVDPDHQFCPGCGAQIKR